MNNQYDVAVIGGGIVGSMTARTLSQYRLRILVIDRAYDVGECATKANSGVLYPGFHHREGSLKGLSCVGGNRMYDTICRELGVPMRRVGSLYAAFGPEGEKLLKKKYERGLANGTPELQILSGDEARRLEPGLSGDVVRALYTPFTGIISPFKLAVNTALSAAQNGVEFLFDTAVTGIRPADEKRRQQKGEPDLQDMEGPVELLTTGGSVFTRFVVNAAGDGAAGIEAMVKPQELVVKPRRGQFFIFDKQKAEAPVLSHVLYQAQEKDEGGTLIAPTIDGNIIAGPTSEDVRTYDNTDTTEEGLAHVERVAKKILPGIDMGSVITSFAGVRANITNVEKEQKDFVVRRSSGFMVSLLGIKNPGMTAAPYLAQKVTEELVKLGMPLEPNPDYDPVLREQKPFLQESPERQAALYREDPRYARVICRCEKITEGDILHVLRSPLPPRSLNGFKKRLRTGMGRCQGGFCTARIVEIFCRETGCRPEEFMKSRDRSPVVKGRIRDAEGMEE
ncbi:MAG: NAD(P)/FAD-dependent oxidoreductase [Anaerovoracaceae bacterium]